MGRVKTSSWQRREVKIPAKSSGSVGGKGRPGQWEGVEMRVVMATGAGGVGPGADRGDYTSEVGGTRRSGFTHQSVPRPQGARVKFVVVFVEQFNQPSGVNFCFLFLLVLFILKTVINHKN